MVDGDVSDEEAGDEVGVLVAFVRDLLFGGLVSVLVHARGVDLVG
jgi:hypothetical protein